MNSDGLPQMLVNAGIATMVFIFSGFILYVTRTPTGDLSVAGVALTGPPIGAVVAWFFQHQTVQQGASISTAGATSALKAAAGGTA